MTEKNKTASKNTIPGKVNRHRYPFVIQIYKILANALGVFLLLVLITSIFQGSFFEGIEFKYYFLWLLFILIPFLTSNHYADIVTDEEHIYVQFLWTHLPVKWEDLLSIEPSPYNLPRRQTSWVVRARKFSVFHRLYGLIYALTPQPCFMISRGIGDFEPLLEQIKAHLPESKKIAAEKTEEK